MKYIISFLSCVFFITAPVFAEMSADEILKKADETLDISHSLVDIEMKVYRKKKLRKTYRFDVKYREWGYMLAETNHPPRNKGEKMLKVDDNQWLYLPKINKVMRVSESNSFSNSDFSNEDIMKPTMSQDYTPTLSGSEDYKGEDVYKLELNANSEDVPYAKVLYWIRKKDFYPLRKDYYTFSGHLLKRMVIQSKTDARGGLPDVFIMSSVLEKNKLTVMRYLKIENGQSFPPETFRKDSLAKR